MTARITAAQRKAKAETMQKRIAYTALGAGVAASLAANYLAAHGGAVSRVVAVWPALALLITVHLFQHAPRNWMVKVAIFLVAGVAAWMSYWHMVEVVGQSESALTAHIFPASVDGMIYVASVVINKASQPVRRVTRARKPAAKKANVRQLKAA